MFTVQGKNESANRGMGESARSRFHVARNHACGGNPRANVAGDFSFCASEHDGAACVIRYSREGFAV